MINYYELLGIERTASSDEISKAYKKKITQFHPDKNNGSVEFEILAKQLTKARDILLDQSKRLNYDRSLNSSNRGYYTSGNETDELIRERAKSDQLRRDFENYRKIVFQKEESLKKQHQIEIEEIRSYQKSRSNISRSALAFLLIFMAVISGVAVYQLFSKNYYTELNYDNTDNSTHQLNAGGPDGKGRTNGVNDNYFSATSGPESSDGETDLRSFKQWTLVKSNAVQVGIDQKEFGDLLLKWNSGHSLRNPSAFEDVYADSILYYGSYYSKSEALKSKGRLFEKHPDFRQILFPWATFERLQNNDIRCVFTKNVYSNKEWRKFESYLHYRIIQGEYKVVLENDFPAE